MTATEQPEHCGHECVCRRFQDWKSFKPEWTKPCNAGSGIFSACPHDTRYRPHTPASSPICKRCESGEEPFCIACERLKPHDAAISRAATLAAYERVRSECIRDESVGMTIFHILQELKNDTIRQQGDEQR